MAQIILEIPDPALPRVLEAFAESFGWDSSTGLTRAQFAKRQVAAWVKDVTLTYERQKAAEAITLPALTVD